MRWLFTSLCLMLLYAPSVLAITSLTITADNVSIDKIENKPIRFEKATVLLDLAGKERLNITADSLHFDALTAQKPQAEIDLTAAKPTHIVAKHVEYQQFEAKNTALNLHLKGQTKAELSSDIKRKTDKNWATTQLNCWLPANLLGGQWRCESGQYKAERINLPFSLNLTPQGDGIKADLQLKEANFSDEAGLHAAEKLSGNLQLSLQNTPQGLRWQNTLHWAGGEVFWQPFYLSGSGHTLQAGGLIDETQVKLENAKLHIHEVGDVDFSGQMQRKDWKITQLDAQMPELNLAQAYPLIFKPLLEKTAFNQAELSGKAALKVRIREAELNAFTLDLHNVNIHDNHKKFAFNGINAHIPWSYDEPQTARFAYAGGQLLNLPLGKTEIAGEVNRFAFTSPKIRLPILDGALELSDISAAYIAQNWFWHLEAKLTPINMADFSRALKIPVMQGQASAEIPLVTYNNGKLTADGEMVLNVFDGTATVSNLTMKTPLGIAPQLNADIALRHLDLGALTRTYSFGAIEGKLDGDIEALELQNWKPTQFDAQLYSSLGKYPKKISQRAVENISALGGAGAAAAIQRSFLQFFKQFNYDKIALNCRLRNDVCEMSGISSTNGGYTIVKGSGIPAITVMGYNHTVGWGELLGRVKRVIDGNTKAVVK